jgi:hypothetical protein
MTRGQDGDFILEKSDDAHDPVPARFRTGFSMERFFRGIDDVRFAVVGLKPSGFDLRSLIRDRRSATPDPRLFQNIP